MGSSIHSKPVRLCVCMRKMAFFLGDAFIEVRSAGTPHAASIGKGGRVFVSGGGGGSIEPSGRTPPPKKGLN